MPQRTAACNRDWYIAQTTDARAVPDHRGAVACLGVVSRIHGDPRFDRV